MFDDQFAPVATPPAEPHRALYLRWRPKRFEDVVGQEHVTRTLRNAVKLGRPSHAYLFTGPRGTGKTSVARILYRAANCDHTADGDPCNVCALCKSALDNRALDLIEIDAASNRGIDDIRDLRDKVRYRPGDGRYRVYIIDEAHELTPQAWDAFLKTLEEPPPHAIFVLATTESHKVPATIVSRCQRFDFRRIPYAVTRDQLQRVAESEGMQIEGAVLERLALVARGGLRDAISLLDQLESFAGGQIDMTVARAALSLPSIEAVRGVLDGMTRRDPATVMAFMSDAAEGGADLRIFAEELVFSLRALLLLRAGADTRLTDEMPEGEVDWLKERAPAWSLGTLMRLVQTLSEALARTRDAQQFQVQMEVALLTACELDISTGSFAPPRQASPDPAPGSSQPTVAAQPPTVVAPAQPMRGEPVRSVAPVAPTAPATVSAPSPPAAPEPAPPAAASSVAAPDPPLPAPTQAAAPPADPTALRDRWIDVVEQVKGRNPLLASTLGSAHPLRLEDDVLTVAFATEFNRKSADKSSSRELIETAMKRVWGSPFRLRCTVQNPAEAGVGGLLDDPVINFATRTFGGQPKRVPTD